MPITRFKSLDEAARALWREPGAPELMDDWNRLYELSKLAPQAPPRRGVFRFKSIEEANRDTEAWIQRRVDAGKKRKLLHNQEGRKRLPNQEEHKLSPEGKPEAAPGEA